MQEWHNR